MAGRSEFVEMVLDSLEPLGGIRAIRMFGGHGVYCGERFFAIVFRDELFFKTDDASRQSYLDYGMEPCRPTKNPNQILKRYYRVPEDILDDPGELRKWAITAIDAAA